MRCQIFAVAICATVMPFTPGATAGPIELVLNPSPQEFSNTCQSYSMGLAATFQPNTPFAVTTPVQLRELERKLRKALEDSAKGKPPQRGDWKVAMEAVSGGKLTVGWRTFDHLDPAMRFIAEKTGISKPETLGPVLSAGLVKTPVMLSFTRVEKSAYPSQHIVTAFGVQLPEASMGDSAKPKLLLANSAVKYPNGVKNICAAEALSDNDKYRADLTLSGNYDLTLFDGKHLVTYVEKK